MVNRVAQLCNSHGFPHAWTVTKYHHSVFRAVVDQVEARFPDDDCIVVDGTWLENIATDEKLEAMYPNVTRENIEHIFYVDLVDPPCDLWDPSIKQRFTQLTTARQEHNIPRNSNFQFWAWFAQNEYRHYFNDRIVAPWNGEKLFLSYNRKPYDHRVTLVRTLTEERLLCKGIVTLGNEDPSKALTVSENVSIDNANVHGDVGIPNDIASLGDDNIWASALINVVTETELHGEFLSEKIWKPIIGNRPFMLLGPPNTLKKLKELGFHTFDKYWDESYQESGEEIQIAGIMRNLKRLSSMSNRQLMDLYADMRESLLFNQDYFFRNFAMHNEYDIKTLVKDVLTG